MISWLVPIYNTPSNYLHDCLISILAELKQGDEIVIVDDASTNKNTCECIQYYAELNPHVKLEILTQNLGTAGALNAGLALCSGDIIARLDSDDWNFHGRIEKQLHWWNEHPADLIGSNILCHYDTNQTLVVPDKGDPREVLAKYHPVAFHPTWLLKRQLLNDLGGYPTEYPFCEDFAFECLLIANNGTYTNVPEVLVNKRQHKDRVSYVHAYEQRDSAKRALKDFLGIEK